MLKAITKKAILLFGVILWVALWEGTVRVNALPADEIFHVTVNETARTIIFPDTEPPIQIAVSADANAEGLQLKVAGFDGEQRVDVLPLEDPVRILVDFFLETPPFKTISLPVDIKNVTDLRMGHHPGKVRIVLGIDGEVPVTRLTPHIGGFTLSIGTQDDPQSDQKKNGLPLKQKKASPQKNTHTTKTPPAAGGSREMSKKEIGNVSKSDFPPSDRSRAPADFVLNFLSGDGAPLPKDRLFSGASTYYNARNWQAAVDELENIIRRFPQSDTAEKAWFLLPGVYEKLYRNSLDKHFRELTDRYRDVLSRFPDSRYIGGAMLGLADLYYQLKNYAEALGYYKLAADNSPESAATALKAKLQTARIYYLKNRVSSAKALLKKVMDDTESSLLRSEAMLEMAGILHDEKQFNASLDLLVKLLTMDPDNLHRFPELSLYIGNNHFQLGHYTRAGKYLLHYYNSAPERADAPLTLARIGDAWLGDGRIVDAVKLFLFVIQRYPATRGANISWIRLAEQQEAHPETAGLMPLSSRQIYEKVQGFFMEKKETDPLAVLATLKLGVLYQNEKRYKESFHVLKTFFSYAPQGVLRENGLIAMEKTLSAMVIHAMEKEDFSGVVSLFEREQPLFERIFSSQPALLAVARAYLQLGLAPKALAIFEKMEPLLSENEKPADLLFFLGRRSFQRGRLAPAMEKISLALKRDLQSPHVGEAYRMMARGFAGQKKYVRAMSMLDAALEHTRTPCVRAGLLIDMADAALKIDAREKALAAVDKIGNLYEACQEVSAYMGDQVGDIYFSLGDPEKAMAFFSRVAEMEQSQVEKVSLQYKMARCLDELGRIQEGMALYQAIAAANAPFWSNLAREHIAGVAFSRE